MAVVISLFISSYTVKGRVYFIMSVMCSTFIFYFISFISLSICFTLPSSTSVEEEKRIDEFQVDDKSSIILVLLKPYNRDGAYNIDGGTQSNRVKRQTDISKFSASKNLSQEKVMQLYLQLYKDLYTTRYNPNPVHPNSIKPVLKLFKKKFIKFFFPAVAQTTT